MSTTPDTIPPVESGSTSSAITRSVVLVLCGYLVGVTAAHVCTPKMEACALGAAAIGLIAQAAFANQARQRQAAHARLAVQKATVRLERRVEQHVCIPSARLMRKLHAARPRQHHEQYITVVRSPRHVMGRSY